MTFSIVACDLDTEQLGVAVASKFLAVGAVVPYLAAGLGAVATQALANTAYGPGGLALLANASSPREALNALTEADAHAAERQAGIVDARGRSASFTGEGCLPWSGGRTGPRFAAQGNLLAGPAVIDEMANAFEATGGLLGERLLAALAAGDRAGGDRRGRQSAALVIVSPGGGYAGGNDRFCDLRVDDHEDPVAELERLWKLHWLLFGSTPEEDKLPFDDALAREIASELRRLGRGPTDGETVQAALARYADIENLESRYDGGSLLDPVVRDHLAAQAASTSPS